MSNQPNQTPARRLRWLLLQGWAPRRWLWAWRRDSNNKDKLPREIQDVGGATAAAAMAVVVVIVSNAGRISPIC
jgi:hypothetical protein